MRVRLTSRSPSLYPTTTSILLRYRTESTVNRNEKLLNLRRFLRGRWRTRMSAYRFVFYLTEVGRVVTETGLVVGPAACSVAEAGW